MAVRLIPIAELTVEQSSHLRSRIFAPEHEFDAGPRSVWDLPSYKHSFYAVIADAEEIPVGTVYAAGPHTATDVAWWIDSICRRQGIGRQLVDALATMLKSSGVTNIGPILITAYGGDYVASSKLVKRLRAHFV